ncbi:MAG TPA: hypothetical protein VN802_16570 [Stellaceae bacterium]|nr:hypothetical protein [Stellaceae bacterium]
MSPAGSLLLTRILAAFAALWAVGWLALIVTPSGMVPVFDQSYRLMVSPFELSSGSDILVRRIIEYVCLLPAAVCLIAAQAIRKRRVESAAKNR